MGYFCMAKRLKITKTKNSESFYIIDDFTDPNTKKRSSYVVERLGNLNSLLNKYNTDSREIVIQHLKEYVDTLKMKDKEEKQLISINLSPSKLIPMNDERSYNIGYLYIINILNSLGLKSICDSIGERYKYQFDLFSILNDLVSTRIIYPGSKRSSYQDAHHFLDTPSYQLEDVYRSLPILNKERYFIESELYQNSSKLFERNTSILYYDCTNFYFEVEEEDDFRKYGKSKENRPNPIVQYGIFMDGSGIPLADITFDGNKNEQFSLRQLENKIENDFNFSRFIVCADAGLNGWENKVYNDKKQNGAYIVTQPIKKMKRFLREWTLDPEGWHIIGSTQTFNIKNLTNTTMVNGKEFQTKDLIFYKERWATVTKNSQVAGKKYTLEEHLIVSYSTKFKDYQKKIRDKKIERAEKLLNNPGKLGTTNPRDPRYYISKIAVTENGEIADGISYSINTDKIREDEKYDGFYAVTTDLTDNDLSLIIKANKQRWEIEESFEIMKTEFRTRPIYVSTKESITGHLLTCFIALLIYRILEKEFLKEKYTCNEIITTLRNMNITYVGGNNYVPAFKRIELIDELAEIFGFQPSREVLTQKYLKKFTRVAKSRKSTKMK